MSSIVIWKSHFIAVEKWRAHGASWNGMTLEEVSVVNLIL